MGGMPGADGRRAVGVAMVLGLICAGAPALAGGPPPVPIGCDQGGCLPSAQDCAHGAPPLTFGEHVGALAVRVGAAGHTLAYAGGNPLFPCGDVTLADHDLVAGNANACDGHADDPLDVHVYTPGRRSTRGLPSLYLLTGSGGTWSDWQVDGFTPQALADRYGTVVVAVGGQTTYYVDWADRTVRAEHQLLSIIRRVEQRYGTSVDRNRRAVLGLSMGGYGAVLLAERHPDLFGQVVSFSGVNDIENPYAKADLLALLTTLDHYSGPVQVNRIWGDPVANDAIWHAENPTDQVCGLRHTWVWFSAGDGIPQAQDAGPGLAIEAHTETVIRMGNDDLAKAMTAAGLRYTYVQRHGIHAKSYWRSDAASVVPTLMRRLATAASAEQPATTACGATARSAIPPRTVGASPRP